MKSSRNSPFLNHFHFSMESILVSDCSMTEDEDIFLDLV